VQIPDDLELLRARVAELERLQARFQETERQLLVAQGRLAGILNIAQDAIISIDSEQRIRMFNKGAESIFGYRAEEILGKPLDLLLPEGSVRAHAHHVEEFGKSNQVARMMGERQEIRGRRRDGSEFAAEASISKLVQPDGQNIYTVILRDVTERKRKEDELRASREELRRLARHIESVRDEESKRIAREVHDELGQSLTVLKMRLSALAREVDPADPLHAKLEELSDSVSEVMQTVRHIATQLRPDLLDALGIEAAISRHVQEFGEATGIDASVEFDELDVSLDPQVSIVLFRIVQEALTNVARHANARSVKVRLEKVTEAVPFLRLEISDDGKGFDVSRPGGQSLGLLGMKERAVYLGGDLVVQSQPGQGTRIIVCAPLTRPQ
jgi:hypothetical protein